ncbi:hypothetical protein T4D_6280 [Trichinella pseudospiralis]|uniref:Uncharacterized protein n=1 Tax=Trichinella pseudospiralis TaxID=6337 RepID=A0A0V1F3L8_TRIPS|nr:hypothetical protein T4D_6280 [Trichinella pseudospiralis]
MKQEVRWKYHTTSGNSEDKTCLNLCDDVLITFHKITNFIIHLISSVMEDYDAICERKVEICLQKRMMIYFELQAMHSSHMQSEALKGYLGFCIRHVKSEYSSCRIVVKVYKHISIQSNGIEDREFNSNRGIHHLFFTVNEEKRMFKMKRIESAESSSLLFKEILYWYRYALNYFPIPDIKNTRSLFQCTRI